MATTALIVDIDGVVSPVHPSEMTWGDEIHAGIVFGPVIVSPTLCRRLDALAALPTVAPAWLTSWDADMRQGMDPWPGRDWPVVGLEPHGREGRIWWKEAALKDWLDARPDVTAVVWCDDYLRTPSRRAALRRRFAARKAELLIVGPKTEVGLTREDVDRIEAWVRSRC